MKSVCIIVQSYFDQDTRVRRKAEALVSAGYSVDVLGLQPPSSPAKNYILDGVNVYTLSLGKKRGSLVRYLYEYLAFLVWAFFKLSFLMGKRRYAVIDINNLPDFLVFAAAYAKWKGAKVVFDMHEVTPEFFISKYGIKPDSLLVWLLKLIEKASFNFADCVININRPIEDVLVGRGLEASKSTIIMNSANEALFASAAEPAGADPAGPHPRFVMMYHGTLTRIYGLDIALQGFALAQEKMDGAQFWILGEGPERSSLETLVQTLGLASKVRIVGSVPPREIPGWLARCDVGVLATRSDVFLDLSFSNKLSEYVIMGKAVIASRLKATRHYFGEESLAYFEPHNVADLASQMVRLYRDPELRNNLARRATNAYAPISWGVMKQRYLEMVATLLGDKAVPRQPLLPTVANDVRMKHANHSDVLCEDSRIQA